MQESRLPYHHDGVFFKQTSCVLDVLSVDEVGHLRFRITVIMIGKNTRANCSEHGHNCRLDLEDVVAERDAIHVCAILFTLYSLSTACVRVREVERPNNETIFNIRSGKLLLISSPSSPSGGVGHRGL